MKLNPFFSYFGSKYRIAKEYQSPKFPKIIEPFAGSAGYSLLYPDRNIVLYDTYEPVIILWNYLINVSENDILSLPVKSFDKNNSIDDLNISQEAKILMGFWLTESQTSPSRYPLSKSRGGNWTERKKHKIAKQLQYIRHWKAELKSYEDVDNEESTWYIDPPYQQAGKRYRQNKIDYKHLAEWSISRKGQVIVCEQEPAKWLDFKLLRECSNASNKTYREVVWYSQQNKYPRILFLD